MSSDAAIRITDLSKCYQIYNQPRDRLKQAIVPRFQRLFGRPSTQFFREFWALKDLCLEIRKGETLGIVGRNGSGKSTLLQLICGTLNPTSGTIASNGRIAALLELGSGFNPEFTGRENVYMNAAVLGLSTDQIDACYERIVDFAEIGDFIDQPLKTYSSGMAIRLAFAVAVSVDPEILVVDEALSVGDELFQRKCFSRIEAIRDRGATILFVSHSGAQIVELCDRALLMEAGEGIALGAPKTIVGYYQKLLYAPALHYSFVREQIREGVMQSNVSSIAHTPFDDPGPCSAASPQESFDPNLKPTSTIEYVSRGATIEEPSILNVEGKPVSDLIRGRTYRYAYTVRFQQSANNVRFGMLIKTVSGLELGGAISAANIRDSLPVTAAGSSYRVEFSFRCALNTGTYFLNAGVQGDLGGADDGYLHRLIDVVTFRVVPESSGFITSIVDFSCIPSVEEIFDK